MGRSKIRAVVRLQSLDRNEACSFNVHREAESKIIAKGSISSFDVTTMLRIEELEIQVNQKLDRRTGQKAWQVEEHVELAK